MAVFQVPTQSMADEFGPSEVGLVESPESLVATTQMHWSLLPRRNDGFYEFFMIFRNPLSERAGKGKLSIVPKLYTGMSVVYAITWVWEDAPPVTVGYTVVCEKGHGVTVSGYKGLYVWSKKESPSRTPAQEKRDFARWRSPEHSGTAYDGERDFDERDFFCRFLSVCANRTAVAHVIPHDGMKLTTLKSGH